MKTNNINILRLNYNQTIKSIKQIQGILKKGKRHSAQLKKLIAEERNEIIKNYGQEKYLK